MPRRISDVEELEIVESTLELMWRDPAQVASQWSDAARIDTKLLRYKAHGDWWDILAESGITLLVTREYEHLVMAIHAAENSPTLSYMSLPHPSGLVADRTSRKVHVASTRNPNQVYDLSPATASLPRLDSKSEPLTGHPLIPVRSRFYPGCLYLHDLALIGGDLYANAVGENSIVRLCDTGGYQRAWSPRSIQEHPQGFQRNSIQLNSIASGMNLETSYFSASTEKPSHRRPGHRNYPVDRRGVIFSGKTREPVIGGLTRPHSARLYQNRLWVDNSGYGEFGFAENGTFTPVVRLPGWTRGLTFHKRIAFVGTSRVLPRFRQYAPGLNLEGSVCGVHAVDLGSGKVIGSLIWHYGNQIFALDWLPCHETCGFPFRVGVKRATRREKAFFYTFKTK